jgi:hypothetical protein
VSTKTLVSCGVAVRGVVRAAAVGSLAAAVVLAVGVPAPAATVPPAASGTLVAADPADNTPNARDGEVRAFAQIGTTVYVGGTFTAIRAARAADWTARSYLFAYDRVTGAISTTFLPQLDGAVNDMVVSPDGKLIVAGGFKTANGVAHRQLVKLEPISGQPVSGWSGQSDGGVVRSLARSGNQLYVGGAFHWIDGTRHTFLARLNATTGAVDPSFQIDADVARAGEAFVWRIALSPDGRTLVAGGNFTQVNGLPRNQLALIDLSGAPVVANWSTQRFVAPCYSWAFNSYVQDVDFSDDGSYFVVGANGGRGDGAYCDSISRWETSGRGDNVDSTWVDYTGTDSVTSVEAADGVVYAGGHFRWLNNANGNDAAGDGAIDRLGIGAMDPVNGMPVNWNPRRSGGSALPPGAANWGSAIPVLWRGTDGLYFGHNSDGMGSEYHGRLGLFPLAGGRTFAGANAPAGATGYLYVGRKAGELAKVPYHGTSLGLATTTSQPNLVQPGAAFAVADKVYWAKPDTAARSGSQLQVSMFNGTVGAPWTTGFNAWFRATDMSGAFYLDGRMYYTRPTATTLFYRYLEPDGYTVGCTEFVLPTSGLDWSTVRGLTWANGRVLFGSTNGSLRSAAFDPTAATGVAVNGASATVLAERDWSSSTLFFATS